MSGYVGCSESETVDQPGAWNGVAAADVMRIRGTVTSPVNGSLM